MGTGTQDLHTSFEVGPIISTVAPTYTLPVNSYRVSAHEDAFPAAIGTMSNYVDKAVPGTKKKIEGWNWGERVWYTEETENAVDIPLIFDATVSGITTTYFQSGIGSGRDLQLESIKSIIASGVNQSNCNSTWSPELFHGHYYHYDDGEYLFSDDSQVVNLTYSGIVQGLNFPSSNS